MEPRHMIGGHSRRGLAVLALAGLSISAAINATTYFGLDLWLFVWWMHFPAMIAVAPAAIMSRSLFHWRDFRRRRFWETMQSPRWVRWTYRILGLYVIACFVLFIVASDGGGTPERTRSGFALMSHEKLLRSLSEDEYHAIWASILRMFSAGWMIAFCFAAIVYHGMRERPKNQAVESRQELEQAAR